MFGCKICSLGVWNEWNVCKYIQNFRFLPYTLRPELTCKLSFFAPHYLANSHNIQQLEDHEWCVAENHFLHFLSEKIIFWISTELFPNKSIPWYPFPSKLPLPPPHTHHKEWNPGCSLWRVSSACFPICLKQWSSPQSWTLFKELKLDFVNLWNTIENSIFVLKWRIQILFYR